jgi:hypothetical protein
MGQSFNHGFAGVGNVIVLAKGAGQVAANGGYAQAAGARRKMEQRLLLDGVYVDGAGSAIHEGLENAALVFAHAAKAAFPFGYQA